jgi:hypothetical protein
VEAAEATHELHALQSRAEQARARACSAGKENELARLQRLIDQAKVVKSVRATEFLRLASSDSELHVTFYARTDAGLRIPEGSKWDVWRKVADAAILSGYERHIHFAALSPDGSGLINYGTCFLALKQDMISHRTSFFESNTVTWLRRRRVEFDDLVSLPPGFRASWDQRRLLGAAKLADSLPRRATDQEIRSLLLRPGPTSADDECIEAHVFGPMSIRTLESVVLAPKDDENSTTRRDHVIALAAGERLAAAGVGFEVAHE